MVSSSRMGRSESRSLRSRAVAPAAPINNTIANSSLGMRIALTSRQMIDAPLHPLPHRGQQVGGLLEVAQLVDGAAVARFHQEIHDGDLYQRRTLILQRVFYASADSGLVGIAAQRIERSEADINA